jgi:hypothetical protein
MAVVLGTIGVALENRQAGKPDSWKSPLTGQCSLLSVRCRSRPRGQRMQDVDRPADIQSFPQPAGARRPGVDVEVSRDVIRSEDVRRVGGHHRWRRDIRQRPPVRPPELERAVVLSIDPISLLVDRSMMPAAEQREVRERRRAALRPVAEVMTLAEWQSTAREATTAVPMVQRPPQRGRDRPGPGSDFHQAPVMIVAHHDPAGVARQPLRRFRGNAHSVLEDGLARLIGVRQHRSIDVHHDLVALARSAGVEPVMKGCLREQGEGVGLLLGHARGFLTAVCCSESRAAWYRESRAAASARRSKAPTSGVSRPRRTTVPSSSG